MMTAKDRCPWRTSSAARLPCSRDGVGYGRIHILLRQFELFTFVEEDRIRSSVRARVPSSMFCVPTRRGQLERDGELPTAQIGWRGHVLGLAAPGVPELRIALRLDARLSPMRVMEAPLHALLAERNVTRAARPLSPSLFPSGAYPAAGPDRRRPLASHPQLRRERDGRSVRPVERRILRRHAGFRSDA
jgi:hypothetical protein